MCPRNFPEFPPEFAGICLGHRRKKGDITDIGNLGKDNERSPIHALADLLRHEALDSVCYFAGKRCNQCQNAEKSDCNGDGNETSQPSRAKQVDWDAEQCDEDDEQPQWLPYFVGTLTAVVVTPNGNEYDAEEALGTRHSFI